MTMIEVVDRYSVSLDRVACGVGSCLWFAAGRPRAVGDARRCGANRGHSSGKVRLQLVGAHVGGEIVIPSLRRPLSCHVDERRF